MEVAAEVFLQNYLSRVSEGEKNRKFFVCVGNVGRFFYFIAPSNVMMKEGRGLKQKPGFTYFAYDMDKELESPWFFLSFEDAKRYEKEGLPKFDLFFWRTYGFKFGKEESTEKLLSNGLLSSQAVSSLRVFLEKRGGICND